MRRLDAEVLIFHRLVGEIHAELAHYGAAQQRRPGINYLTSLMGKDPALSEGGAGSVMRAAHRQRRPGVRFVLELIVGVARGGDRHDADVPLRPWADPPRGWGAARSEFNIPPLHGPDKRLSALPPEDP